jgi:hypothetical protein
LSGGGIEFTPYGLYFEIEQQHHKNSPFFF